uniref:Uncharacterized protein n=1 Tax=Candidatus Kentrum sp. MB TaxID=2138164 RepID=A0A450XZZ7_9GAMM|nr:MAG: hypothetical protein BECKMB1821I_GA0114274_10881 [Candidatus Kentron sp. MB]VFK77010.1 MAG: hypothetical protein BECKMB1821H_GA0114242_10901 [Candidatus Kentron sp. MB]
MTEKTRHETDNPATGFDDTTDGIEEQEKKTRDSFHSSPSPASSPTPDAKSTDEKNAERKPARGRWWNRLWNWLKNRALLDLFFAVLLILSWALSSVGFYVLFSAWSIEAPFGIDALIEQIKQSWRGPGIGAKIAISGKLVLAMFFAALGSFLVWAMSRSTARIDLGPGRRLLSAMLLLVGLFISGMSGFVVIWSYNNHDQLRQDYQEGVEHRFNIAVERVKDHYAPLFDKEKQKILQGQNRQNQIASLSQEQGGFEEEIETHTNDFEKFSKFLRAIRDNFYNRTWVQGQVDKIYGKDRNPMLSHLLGETGAAWGFGPKTTEFAGSMAMGWARELHRLCKRLSLTTQELEQALGTNNLASKPCPRKDEELKREFKSRSLINGKPNHVWLNGAFVDDLEDRFIGPLLKDTKNRLSRFSDSVKLGKQSKSGDSSDKSKWVNFDTMFESRIAPIRTHAKQDPPDFPAAFQALQRLSEELSDQLSEEGGAAYPVSAPTPQRLHTVVRERFFAMWFGSAHYVPGRYLNEQHLGPDSSGSTQSDSKTLSRVIEAVNEMTHFSREGFVTALEDQLQKRLPAYQRAQLLGVADCGRECGRRIAALRENNQDLAGDLKTLGLEYLATASAGDIEGKLVIEMGVDLDDRERDLLQGFIHERTAKLNNEWFAYGLASLADLLAIALGIFAVLSKRGPAKWHKRLLAWVPGTKADYQRKREQDREKRERDFQQRWERVQRFSRAYFMERIEDFDRKKQERWEEMLKTGEGGIDARADASIDQDLILMATGIPGVEMESMTNAAINLGKVYQGIAEDSGNMRKAFRDEVDTLHKTMIEIEAIREQYLNHKEEMKLMVSNLAAARTQAELAATLAKISKLKQSSEEAQTEVRCYVDQSLNNFRSLLTNIEHFDQTDFYHRLSQRERDTYRAFAAKLRENASGLSNLVDEYLSASASGSFGDKNTGDGPNEEPNTNV